MKIGRSLLSPSYNRLPDFVGDELRNGFYQFACGTCRTKLEIDYYSLCNREDSKFENSSEISIKNLKELYGIGIVGKSQDGGWPVFNIVKCNACKAEFVVYTGVNEVANSFFRVTVQGITELVS